MANDSSKDSPTLPLQLVARCASYNVKTSKDLARLRMVSKNFGQLVAGLLPNLGEKTGHFIVCPPKRTDKSSFLLNADFYDETYESYNMSLGDNYAIIAENHNTLPLAAFSGASVSQFIVAMKPTMLNEFPSKKNGDDDEKEEAKNGDEENEEEDRAMKEEEEEEEEELDEKSKLIKLKETLLAMKGCDDKAAFTDLGKEIKKYRLMKPVVTKDPPVSMEEIEEEGDDIYIIPSHLTMFLDKDASCIVEEKTTKLHDGTEFFCLRNSEEFDGDSFNVFGFGCEFRAVVTKTPKDSVESGTKPTTTTTTTGAAQNETDVDENMGNDEGDNNENNNENDDKYEVQMLCYMLAHSDALWNFEGTLQNSFQPIQNTWKQFLEKVGAVEGVMIADDVVGMDLVDKLKTDIDRLAEKQKELGTVDYHPFSNDIVRDIVHPGLYSYVKGVSKLARNDMGEVPTCIFPKNQEIPEQADGTDFWGRPYETSRYQWLPTYFQVGWDGSCTIKDYINNLSPREDPHIAPLYESLSRLFERCLPYMEAVYGYVHGVRPFLRLTHEGTDYNEDALREIDQSAPTSFRGQQLQVITKIVDYELKPGQSHEGVWHVEGMSHEEIVLTCLYILDRDEKIEGGEIKFKRAFLSDEAEFIFSNMPQSRHTAVEEFVGEGLVPLGKVETLKGRLVVFPNSHVHKVEMMNHFVEEEMGKNEKKRQNAAEEDNIQKRRIVVFFLVNPTRRIVSTREVEPQQEIAGGAMSLDDALTHRLALMRERKYKKQDWNVREIELCEH